MNAPDKIKKLTETFDYNLETYKKDSYNETQVRREFIDPFFEALGWDIANKKGYAEAYKDVIHEDAIKIGGATKAPDYCFRIGGARKFFLEAKKPAVNIKTDIHPAFQLRRYGWSAKLPLSILTDFEEFAVYDCRVRPVKTDMASHSRIFYLKYTDYIDRWEEIESVFSRVAILKGSFDKYAASWKNKRGTALVDTAFLQEIERWRELLARNIALRNKSLSQRELNFAIQQTVDRIIFLRICEDRGIEKYGRLMALQNGVNVYKRLFELFSKADDKYNSGLFHFKKEKNRKNFDNLTPALSIDDKVLKDIFKNLYYPDSPYEFSVLPADILGQVYEKFLGKVIRLTPKHQAKIEEKPEVRKAGGVYYTPTYVVDYIVKQTVGKLVKGKKAGPRGAVSRLKILDPACGSGSFLIGAYQFLSDWHLDQYVSDNPEKLTKGKKPRLYQTDKGEWRLTADERKRILLNNIYGVDIDPQAVEVTKLSLLLKVLEGENEQSIGQLAIFQERVLPDLSNNIKCGNSLIGPDFYEKQQMNMFDEEEIYRVNAFDWDAEFADIMGKGGFDAVIGNPPYIRIQAMKEWTPKNVEHYKAKYKSAQKGNYDIYVIFVEQGLNLLNKNGCFGFILPHKFFNAKYGEPLRKIISTGKHLSHVIHFGSEQIFSGATTYTCLLFLSKKSKSIFTYWKVKNLKEWILDNSKISLQKFTSQNVSSSSWSFIGNELMKIMNKLKNNRPLLSEISERIFQGFKTGADSVFILNSKGSSKYFSKCLNKAVELESHFLFPLYKSGNFKKYDLLPPEKVIIFPYKNGLLIDWEKIKSVAPFTAKYLSECKNQLDSREKGKWKGISWYRYSRNQALTLMSNPKILIADLNPSANYSLDDKGTVCFTGGAAGGYGIILPDWLLKYVLGLLNSNLLDWFLKNISSTFRGGWFSYESRYIAKIPIHLTNISDSNDKHLYEQVINLVDQMLNLNKKLNNAKLPQEKNMLQRQTQATDKQIDQLVYKLYDLTDEEIKIVESET
ncbi:Eco57I restriction-modification methylase domain-containing protein [Desulfococcaceae bacterium HSG7]|nr:Eco57I restriction-modification methylase domain-containing protein [Desulfococcaceae bacterium HSG7]